MLRGAGRFLGGSRIEVEGAAFHAATDWAEPLAGGDAIVDALFGTGLRSKVAGVPAADVTGVPAAAIAAMNAAPGRKIAVDIPSGVDADTGRICGVAFHAGVTATMGAPWPPSADADAPAGRVEVVSLGVPIRPPPALGPYCHAVDVAETLAGVPRRGPSGHKGTAGHLLIVAGSAGKTGAAWLSARAAMRAGVGLCTVASTAAGQAALDAKAIEIMTARYADGDDADASSAARLSALASAMRALAIGPGIPTGPGMRALDEETVAKLALPLVVDADALNLLAPHAARALTAAPAPRVLTPHPGEMARLLGITTAEVQRTRVAAARKLAADTRAIVVLKGARTLIARPDGTVFINPTANPALGTAGAGDVLTGVVGGAARSGHGRAVRGGAPGRSRARPGGRARGGGDRRPGHGRGRSARRHCRGHGRGAELSAIGSVGASVERSAIVSVRSLSRTW